MGVGGVWVSEILGEGKIRREAAKIFGGSPRSGEKFEGMEGRVSEILGGVNYPVGVLEGVSPYD